MTLLWWRLWAFCNSVSHLYQPVIIPKPKYDVLIDTMRLWNEVDHFSSIPLVNVFEFIWFSAEAVSNYLYNLFNFIALLNSRYFCK